MFVWSTENSGLRVEAENRGPEVCIPNRSGHKQDDVSTQSQACSRMSQTTRLERESKRDEMISLIHTLKSPAFKLITLGIRLIFKRYMRSF